MTMACPEQQECEAYLPTMRASLPMVHLLIIVAAPVAAQGWQPGSAVPLIGRAAAHRTARDADTVLAAWQARAHGVLRFAAVLNHDGVPIERVIRADELEVEVYGEAPNRSKQVIAAWRDTTFLPNALTYHRDHLGIVANDFGPTIRLGQGDEVRDVAHPLSPAGVATYLFRVGDTVALAGPAGRVRVVAIEVRPRDPDAPGAVGTMYLDVDRAALVRFDFTFTPATYRDASVASITVTLENALQRNARWLPWHQVMVIRRALPWLDLPVQSLIRADWQIDDYQFGAHAPAGLFANTLIAGPLTPLDHGPWPVPITRVLDSLPATGADVAAVDANAARELGGRLLDALPHWRLQGAGISDFLRVNRVEGVTAAAGLHLAIGRHVALRLRGGYGFSDQRAIGDVQIGLPRSALHWSLTADRTMQDVGDTPVISGVLNSLQTVVNGDDDGDYTLIDRVMLGASLGTRFPVRIQGGEEWSQSVATRFTPLSGNAGHNPALGVGAASIIRISVVRRSAPGIAWTADVEAGDADVAWARIHATAMGRIAMPSGELQVGGEAGAGTASLPPYRDFVLGGRATLPGVPFRSLGGRRMLLANVAWMLPIALPTPPVPYSRYVPLPSTLGPFVAAGLAGGSVAGVPWSATDRVETVAGLRLDLWGPLLRVETGVSLRTGRVEVTVDAHPDWWPVM